uniref:Mas-related G-protein coupled receptor member B4-like isoform X2 n=1 Tax=Pogona vitticeps TaxID=103695 RepID=A0ABM5GCU8_9SAUR
MCHSPDEQYRTYNILLILSQSCCKLLSRNSLGTTDCFGTKQQLQNTNIFIKCMIERSHLSLMENRKQNARELWNVTFYDDVPAYLSFHEPVLQSLIIFICTAGLVEAGFFIWSLGFCLKKVNMVTTYFLNLAVAEFGLFAFLLVLAALSIAECAPKLKMPVVYLLFFAYTAAVYFLTVISVERCLGVLFPIWNRTKRPTRTSSILSFLVWSTAGFLSGITMCFHYVWSYHHSVTMIRIICSGNVLILTPLVVVSSLISFIDNFSRKPLPKMLRTNQSLRLIFFIFFAMPLSFFYFMDWLGYTFPAMFMWISFLLTCINSTMNPLIHYVLGGQWKRWKSGRT